MLRKIITYIKYPVLIAGIVLCLVGVVYAATNIDSTNKWAWGANVGWFNFNPTHGGGVTVYSDHLEGYAWGENVGWIRMGTYEAGGTHTYANDAANTYGVNNDGHGNLSGYGWSTSAGWINFNPTHGGVTIDLNTGSFDGFAWGENIGWIHFKNTAPAYNVVTSHPFGDLDGDCSVEIDDVMLVASRWRTSCANPDPDNNPATPNYDARYDLDDDCDIDIVDIMLVVAHWGGIC